MSKVSKLATIRAVGILGGAGMILGGVACTSFGAEEPADQPLDAATHPDASSGDGAPDGGTSSENMVSNGGFETQGGGKCGQGWLATNAVNGVFFPTTTKHAGAYACRICADLDGGTPTFFSFDPGGLPPKPGGAPQDEARAGQRYEVRAWLRAAESSPAPLNATLYLRVRKPGGGAAPLEIVRGAPSTLGLEYTFHSFAHTLTQSGLLNVYIEFLHAPNVGCAIIDDFEVVELRP